MLNILLKRKKSCCNRQTKRHGLEPVDLQKVVMLCDFLTFDAGPFAYCKEDTGKGYSTIATFSDLTIYFQRPFRGRSFLNVTETPRYANNPKTKLLTKSFICTCNLPRARFIDSRSRPHLC